MKPSDYVHNLNDSYVALALEKVTAGETGLCRCSRCQADFQALALNRLAPRYTPKEELSDGHLDNLDALKDIEYAALMNAVYTAVHRVRSQPHHQETDNAEHFRVHNQREEVVGRLVEDALAQRSQTHAPPNYFGQVLAHCLNQVQPQYVSTTKGQAFVRSDELESGYHTELLVKVFQAIDVVEKQR